jgi:hypothetical protein
MLRYLCRKLLYGISTTEGDGVSVVGAISSCSILSNLNTNDGVNSTQLLFHAAIATI